MGVLREGGAHSCAQPPYDRCVFSHTASLWDRFIPHVDEQVLMHTEVMRL